MCAFTTPVFPRVPSVQQVQHRSYVLATKSATTVPVTQALHSLLNPAPPLPALKTRNFKESVDISVVLNVDPRKPNQQVQGSVALPAGNGKPSPPIFVFVGESEMGEVEGEVGGMDGVKILGEQDMDKVRDGVAEFALPPNVRIIATPTVLPSLKKSLGRLLGPRSLMPNVKNGSVVAGYEVSGVVSTMLKGSVAFKCDKFGVLNFSIGTVEMGPEDLLANAKSVLEALEQAKPAGVKKNKGNYKYWKRVSFNTTMGAGSVRAEIKTCDPTSAYFFRE